MCFVGFVFTIGGGLWLYVGWFSHTSSTLHIYISRLCLYADLSSKAQTLSGRGAKHSQRHIGIAWDSSGKKHKVARAAGAGEDGYMCVGIVVNMTIVYRLMYITVHTQHVRI